MIYDTYNFIKASENTNSSITPLELFNNLMSQYLFNNSCYWVSNKYYDNWTNFNYISGKIYNEILNNYGSSIMLAYTPMQQTHNNEEMSFTELADL